MDDLLDHLSIANNEIKQSLPSLDNPQSPSKKIHPGLDELSVELKVAILQHMPDVRALRAMVQSSPLYHKAYLGQCRSILSTVLLRDLGPEIFAEALLLCEASKIPWGDAAARKEGVEALVARYKSQLDTPPPFSPKNLDSENREQLARFQGSVFDTTSDFCRSRLSIHPTTHDELQRNVDISQHERYRIYRALYRFQMFHTLFSIPTGIRRLSDGSSPNPFDSMDMSHLFFSIFNPWEVEEIACIHDYLMECYSTIYSQCLDFLVEFRPSTESSLRSISVLSYQEHSTSLGLAFFRRVLSQTSPRSQAEILKDYLWDTGTSLIDGV